MKQIDWLNLLSREDYELAERIMSGWREPDLIIAPDGSPYLYRWHIIPRNTKANVYFHIQVADDPARPLHDHPWDNTSVILSGGYDELITDAPGLEHLGSAYAPERYSRGIGDVIHRLGATAHRLILPSDVRYTMTLFTTGPKYREWGFWYPDGWKPYHEVTAMLDDGVTVINKRHT